MNIYYHFVTYLFLGFIILLLFAAIKAIHYFGYLLWLHRLNRKSVDTVDAEGVKRKRKVKMLSKKAMKNIANNSKNRQLYVKSYKGYANNASLPDCYTLTGGLRSADSNLSLQSFESSTTSSEIYKDWRHSMDFNDFLRPKVHLDPNKNIVHV